MTAAISDPLIGSVIADRYEVIRKIAKGGMGTIYEVRNTRLGRTFALKTIFFLFFFIWVRWTVPRFRYDQVMKIGWSKLLPLAIANLIVCALGIAAIDAYFS